MHTKIFPLGSTMEKLRPPPKYSVRLEKFEHLRKGFDRPVEPNVDQALDVELGLEPSARRYNQPPWSPPIARIAHRSRYLRRLNGSTAQTQPS
jgi:hypothetical protein